MTESILTSTKKVLGIAENYTAYDPDITMFINSALATLHQLGVGPVNGFSITDKNQTWDLFIQDELTLNNVQAYVFLSVRLLFDPPQSGYATTAFEKQLGELAYRINVRREELKYPWPEPIVLGKSYLAQIDEEVNWG